MDAIGLTARCLQKDCVAAEVVAALRRADVRSVLLKGASIATWLYADGGARPYGDIDLLVPAERLRDAEAALRSLGFALSRPGLSPHEKPVHARAWSRRGEVVDLHRTLWGIGVDPNSAWRLLAEETETLAVGAEQVEVLGLPARALHVALHAAQHGTREQKPRRDLGRAAGCVSLETWQQAAWLARALDAAAPMAAGLRLHPSTARLAEELGLPRDAPLVVKLRATGGPAGAIALAEVARVPGVRGKISFGARMLIPTTARIQARYPLATHGLPGLALAHLVRLVSLARDAPVAFVTLWRAARSTGATSAPPPPNDAL